MEKTTYQVKYLPPHSTNIDGVGGENARIDRDLQRASANDLQRLPE